MTTLARRLIPTIAMKELDIIRRKRRWRRAGVIFFHVPKAGGVTISDAIFGQPLGHFRASDIKKRDPDLFNSLFTFGLVRDPLTRLVSAYKFAKAGGSTEMRIHNPRKYTKLPFGDFNSFVQDWLSHQDLSQLDGVFQPQSLYLCEGGKIIVDSVTKLEEIDSVKVIIERNVGRKLNLHHKNKAIDSDVTVPMISSETSDLVRALYAQDYQNFGY